MQSPSIHTILMLAARMILNLKGIDYKTEWVEYPDLVPTLKAAGLPPNDPSSHGYFMDYTSPAIRLADGTYMMDSWKIAHALEERYPSPPLHLDKPIVEKIANQIGVMRKPIEPLIIPKVPKNILNKVSADYFELTREERYGKPLSLLESEDGGEKCWEGAKKPIQEAADLLNENGGPYFLGETSK
jgi:hypothetical protein